MDIQKSYCFPPINEYGQYKLSVVPDICSTTLANCRKWAFQSRVVMYVFISREVRGFFRLDGQLVVRVWLGILFVRCNYVIVRVAE